MIKSNHKITLDIDGIEFKVVISDPTAAQKTELVSYGKDYDKSLESFNDANMKYISLADEYKINKILLEDVTLLDRMKIALEQKALIKEITAVKVLLVESSKSLSDSSVTLEKIFEKRFDLLVSGDDKVALKKVIVDKNVSFENVFSEISLELEKAKAKK